MAMVNRYRFVCRAVLPTTLILGLWGCESEPVTPVKDVKIEMTGNDFKWISRYAGKDGEFNTEDDLLAQEVLHVPLNADIEIVLKSLDYLYSLEVPIAGKKEIAVPDLTFSLRFKADQLGTFEMPGDQMCGYTHPDLMGTLIVESQEDYARWMKTKQ
tara:strand:- start:95 stop:565 length:471 start_codon:yes stop_codon:yes gene_type:complete